MTKFGLEVLTGKTLSFRLEFIDKTGEKAFCLQTQINLSLALLYLVDLFINNLKTKFYDHFYRMILNTKRIPFKEISLQELNRCLPKFYL